MVKTTHYKSLISSDIASFSYDFIKNNTKWIDSIYSKKSKSISRKAYSSNLIFSENDIDNYISELIINIMKKIDIIDKYLLLGTYVNYYRDGNDFAPAHSHPKQVQLVISLGTTRQLKIGKKIYNMESGDVIIFGSGTHEILQDKEITEGRISIATFMIEK